MRISITIFYCLLLVRKSLHGQSEKELNVDFTEMDSLQYVEFRKEYSSQIKETSIALMTFDCYCGRTGDEPMNVKYMKGEIKYLCQ